MNVISMKTAAQSRSGPRFRIYRYPTTLIDRVELRDGRSVTIRPVLPQDADLQRAFVAALSPAMRYRRFHGPVNELPESTLSYMTEVDDASHMALLATTIDSGGRETQVAEARWVRREPPDSADVADFALAVADDWQRAGLGALLLGKLSDSAAAQGIRHLSGDVLADNDGMRRLLKRNGWRQAPDRLDARLIVAQLDLDAASAERLTLAAWPDSRWSSDRTHRA
jgi:acetyltransferase